MIFIIFGDLHFSLQQPKKAILSLIPGLQSFPKSSQTVINIGGKNGSDPNPGLVSGTDSCWMKWGLDKISRPYFFIPCLDRKDLYVPFQALVWNDSKPETTASPGKYSPDQTDHMIRKLFPPLSQPNFFPRFPWKALILIPLQLFVIIIHVINSSHALRGYLLWCFHTSLYLSPSNCLSILVLFCDFST